MPAKVKGEGKLREILVSGIAEKKAGKASKSTKVSKNLLAMFQSSITDLSDKLIVRSETNLSTRIFRTELLYSSLSAESLYRFTHTLIKASETAIAWRDVEVLTEISNILINLPLDRARHAGLYYRAFVLKRLGEREAAQTLFDLVSAKGLTSYQARALQTLGAMRAEDGHFDDAILLYNEAVSASGQRYFLPAFLASQALINIRGLEGDYHGFLEGLKSISGLVIEASRVGRVYYDGHKANVAYALAQLGRPTDAEAMLRPALASPYSPVYTEWTETQREIDKKQESTPVLVSVRPLIDTKPPRPSGGPWLLSFWTVAFVSSLDEVRLIAPPVETRINVRQTCLCFRSRAPPTLQIPSES